MKHIANLILALVGCASIAQATCNCANKTTRTALERATESLVYTQDLEAHTLMGDKSNGVFHASSGYTGVAFDSVQPENFIVGTNALSDLVNNTTIITMDNYISNNITTYVSNITMVGSSEGSEFITTNYTVFTFGLPSGSGAAGMAARDGEDEDDSGKFNVGAGADEVTFGGKTLTDIIEEGISKYIEQETVSAAVRDEIQNNAELRQWLTERIRNELQSQLESSEKLNKIIADEIEWKINNTLTYDDADIAVAADEIIENEINKYASSIERDLQSEINAWIDNYISEMLPDEMTDLVADFITCSIEEYMRGTHRDFTEEINNYANAYWDEHLIEHFQSSLTLKKWIDDQMNNSIDSTAQHWSVGFDSQIVSYALDYGRQHLSEYLLASDTFHGYLVSAIERGIKGTAADWDFQSVINEHATELQGYITEQLQSDEYLQGLCREITSQALQEATTKAMADDDLNARLAAYVQSYFDEHLLEDLEESEEMKAHLANEISRNIQEFGQHNHFRLDSDMLVYAREYFDEHLSEELNKHEGWQDWLVAEVDRNVERYKTQHGTDIDSIIEQALTQYAIEEMKPLLEEYAKTYIDERMPEKLQNSAELHTFLDKAIQSAIYTYTLGLYSDPGMDREIHLHARDYVNQHLSEALQNSEELHAYLDREIRGAIYTYTLSGHGYEIEEEIRTFVENYFENNLNNILQDSEDLQTHLSGEIDRAIQDYKLSGVSFGDYIDPYAISYIDTHLTNDRLARSETLQQYLEGEIDTALENYKVTSGMLSLNSYIDPYAINYFNTHVTTERLGQSEVLRQYLEGVIEENIQNYIKYTSDWSLLEEIDPFVIEYFDTNLTTHLQSSEVLKNYMDGEIDRNIQEYISETEFNFQSNINEWTVGQMEVQMNHLNDHDELWDFIIDTVQSEIQKYINNTDWNLQSNIDEWAVAQRDVYLPPSMLHSEKLFNFINNSIRSEIQEYIDNTDWNLQSNIAEYAEGVLDLNLPNDLRDSDKLVKFITDSIFAEIQKYIDTTEYDLQSDIDEWAKGKIALALQNATVTINCITNETYENNYVTNVFANVYETFETNTVVTVNSITNDVYETTYVTNQVFTENFTTNYVTTENYTTNYVYDGHVVDVDVVQCDCDMEGLENRITALEDVDAVTQGDFEEMIIDMHGYVDDGDRAVQDNLDALETHIFDYIDEKIGEIPICECDLTSITNDLEYLKSNTCSCDSSAILSRLDSIEGTLSGWDSVTNQVSDNTERIGAEVRELERTIQALQNQVHALEDAMYYLTNNTSSATAPQFRKKESNENQ